VARRARTDGDPCTDRTSDPKRAPPALVRGAAIVERVRAATIQEIARVGYRALRVEDVAARARVNKTTVYRRWPEKAALLRDALDGMTATALAPPDTGSLRGDLCALGRAFAGLASSCQGQSIVRMLFAEGFDPEVADIKKSMRKRHQDAPGGIIPSAIARGDLAPDVDDKLLLGTFLGAIHHRIFFLTEAAGPEFVEALVDLLLAGACKPVTPKLADPSEVASPASVKRPRKARA
jgi:AcrR family transcriptional regulator